jgi:hypothetical protein
VGRIVSADHFEPKYATIIQNKDELKIPLLLETIPTPTEFKDAIQSLSPEQQRFCKAFRSMQLGIKQKNKQKDNNLIFLLL